MSATTEKLKEIVQGLGADLCGVAPVSRFDGAPSGFHPTDIFTACRAVVVFAKREPAGILLSENLIPYTHVDELVLWELDHLGLAASRAFESLGLRAVPVPADDPYEHWEPGLSRGMGILSMRHAGYLAGLGVMGKSTLLINDRLGNMMLIGAVLIDAEMEGDPLATYKGCISDCSICIDNCPVGALGGESVNQALCRPRSMVVNERGFALKNCNLCRRNCPNALGTES